MTNKRLRSPPSKEEMSSMKKIQQERLAQFKNRKERVIVQNPFSKQSTNTRFFEKFCALEKGIESRTFEKLRRALIASKLCITKKDKNIIKNGTISEICLWMQENKRRVGKCADPNEFDPISKEKIIDIPFLFQYTLEGKCYDIVHLYRYIQLTTMPKVPHKNNQLVSVEDEEEIRIHFDNIKEIMTELGLEV